jgi:predicted Zn-dependent protease
VWDVKVTAVEVSIVELKKSLWIEDGQIAYRIKNLRFNQVLPEMLREVDALSSVQRFHSSVVSGVRVKAFYFSSVTDSV